jgi:pyruvate ferredoxin oxidoreductase gamma subunit
MFRIRFHGRGGQGMKTASRVLGSAFFLSGYEVQDAPRYGAERRGAPVFAYVRAAKQSINERGVINQPDLVVVADDTLIGVPAAGVLAGIEARSVLLLNTRETIEEWRRRLNMRARIVVLPVLETALDRAAEPYIGAACAGAAACLLGVIDKAALEQALRDELAELSEAVVTANIESATKSFDALTDHAGAVAEGVAISARDYVDPEWVLLPFEDASVSAPVIHAGATSVEVRTGLWRTLRPVIDYDRCKHCWWVCSTYCPDGAIPVEDGVPRIDLDHCKGCMICVTQCPSHAIEAIAEQDAQAAEAKNQ